MVGVCKLCGVPLLGRGTIGLRRHFQGVHRVTKSHAVRYLVVWHREDPEVRP